MMMTKNKAAFQNQDGDILSNKASGKDWYERSLIYNRVENAVVLLQTNFRSKKQAKHQRNEIHNNDTRKNNQHIIKIRTISEKEEKEEEEEEVEDYTKDNGNKEQRGLDDDFWSRCATAIFIFLTGSFMTVLGILTKCLSKFHRDNNPDIIDVTTQANTGSGPTP